MILNHDWCAFVIDHCNSMLTIMSYQEMEVCIRSLSILHHLKYWIYYCCFFHLQHIYQTKILRLICTEEKINNTEDMRRVRGVCVRALDDMETDWMYEIMRKESNSTRTVNTTDDKFTLNSCSIDGY